ncbi:MAG: murein biosynthesis integral membrane protein MurJ [Smithella sp.]|nr:murein biosynthesis integral membrane protein MurJ [Smithella sp.]HOU51842.1 murein biosynthesis integral membrane protein MurJ [Smithella sp.]HQG66034.1 murein biosynthesis integral membrane protein MurJ [Smithella sp.]HQI73538.1 murein biosynthesis integral membrane protein MurJ [Smithella sp.]
MEQKKHSENKKVVKAAGIVGAATMVSRVFGLLRDMVIAAFFGASWMTDAFWVAFRIPNMLRRLLGEGSLTISFVPVFTEYLEKKSKDEAIELAQNAFTILSVILAFVSVVGILISPIIVGLIAPGFISDPQKFALTVFLNRLMFPYIFFIALVALCMGILNSFRHFTAPALSPVLLNIAMIASAFLLRPFFAEPITSLAVGVLIGGVLQLAMQWPFLLKFGFVPKWKFHLQHPGIKQIGLLMLPAILGAGVSTINVFVGTILASLLPGGSVTYLFYADRIMELPLGVFAIAIGTAALPSFSKHVVTGRMDELKSGIAFSLRLMLFLTIPATVALMALNLPIISVLFQRGAFDVQAAVYTGQALFCYALGLCAFSLLRVFVSSFYSLQDSKWPLKAAIITLIVNLVASLILMYPLKHNGIALASSISAIVNVLILAHVLKTKIGTYLDREFYSSVSKIVLSAFMMVGAIGLIEYFMPWDTHASLKIRLIFLSATIVCGAGVFLVSAYLLKSPEMHAVINILKKRLGHS